LLKSKVTCKKNTWTRPVRSGREPKEYLCWATNDLGKYTCLRHEWLEKEYLVELYEWLSKRVLKGLTKNDLVKEYLTG